MKMNSKPLAFILTLMLLFTLPVTVFAETDGQGTIGGGSTVDSEPLHVMLPTTLSFALDPLGLSSEENQINSPDYFFVNQTKAPVKLELNITATMTSGAVLVSSPVGLHPDDPNEKDKEIYFAALGAGSLTGEAINITDTAITASAVITSTSGVYAYTSSAATRMAFTPATGGATGSAVIGFALGKATDGTTEGAVELATSNAGIAVFQFYAELNTYAEWKANDITVQGSYTLTPLRTTTYNNYTGEFLDGSWNQIEMTTATPVPYGGSPGFIVGDATVTTLESAVNCSQASTSNISVPFYFGEANLTITSMVTNGTFTVDPSHYEKGSNAIILKKDGPGGVAYVFDTASVGAKTMTVTLSNESTYTFTLNVTL